MKQVKAFIHHVRSAVVVDALREKGFVNVSLFDVKGSLKPLSESEYAYTSDAGVVISEVQISLVYEDHQVPEVTSIIRDRGKIGANISGWQRYLFPALSLVISIWLVRALLKRPSLLESASYSFILGGALGNAVDRLWRGSVVDYLDFHWGGVPLASF